ncbi:MAG TPA: N-acetyltransferase family protein [Drouetiella sp.]|jgi:L-amino acid N-acyltransferase
MTLQPSQTESPLLVAIRPAVEPDIAAIRDIYNYFVTNSTATFATAEETLEERRAWFVAHDTNNLPIIVAEYDGRVVGWASLSFYHQRCAYRQTVEISFYIDKEFVGRGIGRQLTESLIESAREHDFHCLVSLVCSENDASIALLKKFDFQTVGVLKEVGKKFDRWLDVTLMQKML